MESLESMHNTKLNGLRKFVCLRESKVSVEGISVCHVIEKLMEHGIHCLPCSYSNDIGLLLYGYDVILISKWRH